LLKWNPKALEIHRIEIPLDLISMPNSTMTSFFMQYACGKIFLFTTHGGGGNPLMIDVKTHEFSLPKENWIDNTESIPNYQQKIAFLQATETEDLLAFDMINMKLIEFNASKNELKKNSIYLSPDILNSESLYESYHKLLSSKQSIARKPIDFMLDESSFIIPSMWIDILVGSDSEEFTKAQVDALATENSNLGNAGNTIYEAVSKWVSE
jgi:hypothetical protein